MRKTPHYEIYTNLIGNAHLKINGQLRNYKPIAQAFFFIAPENADWSNIWDKNKLPHWVLHPPK